MSAAPPAMRDPWLRRRRVIYGALIFIAGNLVYLEAFAPDDPLHQQLALGFIGAATAIIGSYVFGAAWENRPAPLPPDQSTSE